MYDFLKKVDFFSGLADDDLARLCEMVQEIRLRAGDELITEGSIGDEAYVIKEGSLEIIKSSGGRSVLLAVRGPGDVIGEMSLLESSPRFATVRAKTDALLLSISHKQLGHLLETSPSAARAMLYTVTARFRSSELALRQNERMAQLGTLTAGIAHELNNPAAAAQRGADQLRSAIAELQSAQFRLSAHAISEQQMGTLMELDQMARERAAQPVNLDSLSRSDREAALEDWLDEQGVNNAWELAPVLVNLGYEPEQLQMLQDKFPPDQLPEVIGWLGATYSIYNLLEEIHQGAERISETVKALKSYVYLDQAPMQQVDIHSGLDNTLVMLRGKLKTGVTVKREYAPDLPHILVFGSELNQVWTNIIDNAIDAMDGRGEITIRTYKEEPWVVVEINDNGPGIPDEIQEKIFSPYFTTKPVGKGTGMGLNISSNIVRKHGGEIKAFSQPGRTCFQVKLPLDFEAVQSGKAPIVLNPVPADNHLLEILDRTHTIAVVGISESGERPSHTVPAYLQRHGYRIIPVNPKYTEILGEKAYPELRAVPEPVDLVLIFRRSESVPPIVADAIAIGAQTVWMQEGIIHERAAEAAHEAGLDVVMDTCMRSTYKRLKGS
jgi:signal transduction histidine kinase/predicted CoA-binding protein